MNQAISLLATVAHFVRARWRWRFLQGRRLRAFQERRARRIVEYSNRHSPFYHEHWAGHDRRRWRTLPTVDKRLMMANFDRFNTAGIWREEAMSVALQAEASRDFSPTVRGYTVGLSSGTSGHRGIFVAGPWEQAAWAGSILSRTIHDLRPRRLRVAFFLRSNSNLYEKVGGLLVQFRFFDLMMPLAEAVEKLNEFKPHIVVGPPSLLGFLAEARREGTLDIEPERLVSVAEVLEPQDATYIVDTFKAPVHQIYQCTEGLLAVSCREGSLHVQEDAVVLQLEPLGTSSGDTTAARVSPIVTDLWRTTQPIIRYHLNDVLRMSGKRCACGSPFRVIEAIEGRSDDIVYFMQEDGTERPFFPDTIRRMVLLAGSDIEDYMAVQSRTGQLCVYLSVPHGADFAAVSESVRKSVDATISAYGCLPAEVSIENGLPTKAAGVKRRRVVRQAVEGT
ncbi:MAG: F390 synthetase-related protein [Chloroflexota bacterium]